MGRGGRDKLSESVEDDPGGVTDVLRPLCSLTFVQAGRPGILFAVGMRVHAGRWRDGQDV